MSKASEARLCKSCVRLHNSQRKCIGCRAPRGYWVCKPVRNHSQSQKIYQGIDDNSESVVSCRQHSGCRVRTSYNHMQSDKRSISNRGGRMHSTSDTVVVTWPVERNMISFWKISITSNYGLSSYQRGRSQYEPGDIVQHTPETIQRKEG